MPHRICAIIVAYNPDNPTLATLIETIRPSIEGLIVVNNGPPIAVNADIIQNADNVGVGGALNQGIRWAQENGFSAVILFDQDSKPAADMVPQLRGALELSARDGQKIAAVGPLVVDSRTGRKLPFLRWKFPRHEALTSEDATIRTDFLITSGCLISMSAVAEIGLMDEPMFIDNVDMEWCARAVALGYTMYGVPSAKMHHSIGDKIRKVRILWIEKDIIVHSPMRQYYIMRNRIHLYRLPHVKFEWKFEDFLRLMQRLIIFSTFVGPRLENISYMAAGIFHGIIGRRGKLR